MGISDGKKASMVVPNRRPVLKLCDTSALDRIALPLRSNRIRRPLNQQ
jgi:hypothetical protein